MLPSVSSEFGCLYGKPGIGQHFRRVEMEAQLDGAAAQALLALADAGAEQAFEQDALRRRLRMDLVAYPLILNRELVFQRIDNTRADIAEGSYVVGEYPDRDSLEAHLISPISSRPPRRSRG
jgi:hypothetical protein